MGSNPLRSTDGSQQADSVAHAGLAGYLIRRGVLQHSPSVGLVHVDCAAVFEDRPVAAHRRGGGNAGYTTRHRLVVRTGDFQSPNAGSIPAGVTGKV